MSIVFCHGLESGPHGRKYHALRDAGLNVTAPDFRGQNLAQRVETLVAALADALPAVVVGSSYGGATAVCAAVRIPMHALVLCAPALGRDEEPMRSLRWPGGIATIIVHGTRDDVCAIEHSQAFARHDGVELIEVDDDHRLGASLDAIVAAVKRAS